MGNPKTEITVPEAHLLGSSEFRPVQLPFLKMPQPADEVKTWLESNLHIVK